MHHANKRPIGILDTLWPIALSVVVVAIFCMVASLMLFDMRRSVMQRAEENASNLVSVIEQDVGRNIELIGLSLEAVVEGYPRPEVRALSPELRQLVLFDRSASAKNLGALAVFDEHGELQLEAGSFPPRKIAHATDRDYFKAQIDGDSLFISAPYTSRLLGTEVVGVSRRISQPDGTFGGVALGTLQLSYFKTLFARLNIGSGGVISLVRTDGALLVREPAAKGQSYRNVAYSPAFQRMLAAENGRLIAQSGLDAKERVYTFRRIAGLPLIVTVGLDVDDIYADWRVKALVLGAIMLAISIATLALIWILVRELRRRNSAERLLKALNADLARISLTDALTGLANRRQYDEVIAREVRRAARTGRPLVLLLIDADRFKRYNDRYGHHAGDRVLQEISTRLKDTAGRSGDLACRIGGEEFAVILPDTELAGAIAVAERVLQAMRDANIPHADNEPGCVTVSIGAAQLVIGEDVTRLYARSDAALYESKRQGRNCVTASERGPRIAGRAA